APDALGQPPGRLRVAVIERHREIAQLQRRHPRPGGGGQLGRRPDEPAMQRVPPQRARDRHEIHRAAAFSMPSTSSSSSTSSPTRTPPLSSALFQLRPKSLRLIVPRAAKLATRVPHGDLSAPRYSTFSVTALVTPRIVRSASAV